MDRKKVLIVEDSEKNLKLAAIIVQSMGYEALTAVDGEEGVRVAMEGNPDLVLMDIQMPKMDGITALNMLKADEKTKGIPIIAMTSYAMKGDMEQLLSQGFADYIAKPIEKNRFIEAVEKALKG